MGLSAADACLPALAARCFPARCTAASGLGEVAAEQVLARYATPLALHAAYKAEADAAARAGRDPAEAARGLLAREAGVRAATSARIYDSFFATTAAAP